jgi:hypothetical protein
VNARLAWENANSLSVANDVFGIQTRIASDDRRMRILGVLSSELINQEKAVNVVEKQQQ